MVAPAPQAEADAEGAAVTSPLLTALKAYRRQIAAPWFTKAWDLNLFVARSDRVGLWDDFVIVATVDDVGRNVLLQLPATADAWQGEWTGPTNGAGCVFTLPGHYKSALQLGQHNGRPALRQVASMRSVRWPAAMARIPTVAELELQASFTGIVGTHIHNRVSDKTPMVPGTDDSEGCVVLLYQHDHAALIRICEQQRDRHGVDKFSPTYCTRAALGLA